MNCRTIVTAVGAIAVVAGLACVPSEPAHAAASDCAFPGPRAAVSVAVNEGRVAVDNTHDPQALSQLRRRLGVAADGRRNTAGWRSAGLTVSHSGYRLSVRVEAANAGSGQICARLSAATLNVGMQKLDVYVARDYAPGSCAYRTVLAHEYQHVAIYRSTLKQHVPSMERRLTAAAHRLRPVRAASPKRAARHFQQLLQAELEPVFQQMNRAADEANAALDTPANYRLAQSRCTGW